MIDNDIGSEASPDRIIRESFFKFSFDGSDGKPPAVIEACTKAYYQKFILSYIILIPRIIKRSISLLVVFLILFLLGRRLFGCRLLCLFRCDSVIKQRDLLASRGDIILDSDGTSGQCDGKCHSDRDHCR